MASTTALPPPTCTARREAGQHLLAAVLLRGLYRPDRLRLFCFKACAGRIVRRLCLPAAALFSRLCLPATFAMPCPLPSSTFLPHSMLLCPTCSCPCAPGSSQKQQFASCKNCPVGSYNAGLQWWPVHRVASIRSSLCCRDCPVGSRARRLHLRSPCAIVHCTHLKGGGLGLRVSSRPSSPHLRFMSQGLHASSLVPC